LEVFYLLDHCAVEGDAKRAGFGVEDGVPAEAGDGGGCGSGGGLLDWYY
jgi:hypothetical protein